MVVAARGPAAQQRRAVQEAEHLLAVEGQPVADGDGSTPRRSLTSGRPPAVRDLHGDAVVAQDATGFGRRAVLGEQGGPAIARSRSGGDRQA